MSRDLDGDVYFIQAANGLIKIGLTMRPTPRLSELRASSPVPLQLLATLPEGGQEIERHLQYRFRAAHSHGEWFHPTSELLTWITAHAKPYEPATPRGAA